MKRGRAPAVRRNEIAGRLTSAASTRIGIYSVLRAHFIAWHGEEAGKGERGFLPGPSL